MSNPLEEPILADDTEMDNLVDSRKAVSAYIDAAEDAVAAHASKSEEPLEREEAIEVNKAEVEEIASRVGGLSKAMRIVAYSAYHDSSNGEDRREAFEVFSSEFYRLAQECDRAVRQFDSVINRASKNLLDTTPKTKPEAKSEDSQVA